MHGAEIFYFSSMQEQEDFLRKEYVPLLSTIDPATPPAWGKMNLQQAIEHMSDSFRQANGKDPKDCINPPEVVEKMQAFLMSDKPFRENTPNVQMPEEPLPARFDNVDDSLGELQMEINDFFDAFDQDKHRLITNPFFGDLDFEKWVRLLHKHAVHHLRQFGVIASAAKTL